MSLQGVWLQTLSDGLIRADQVIGIRAHRTAELTGKPARWLLDVVLPAPAGSGQRDGWTMTTLHRTLIQTPRSPEDAPAVLARLLAQLDAAGAAGVITTHLATGTATDPPAAEVRSAEAALVRFRFAPFPAPEPGRHAGTEYL